MREPPGPLWGRAASCCCVALLVFRAPEGPAAREARRPRFARRRASKPARALRSLRRPSHQWGLVRWCVAGCVVSKPGQAPPPPTGTAAGPSGALHTSGARCADVWLGTSARSLARPCRRPPAPRQLPPVPSTPVGPGALVCGWVRRLKAQLWLSISNFARNSSMPHSNIEFASLELQRFWGVSKNDRDKLHAKFGWRWCCCCPRVPQPCPVGQVVRWFETIVAFAGR